MSIEVEGVESVRRTDTRLLAPHRTAPFASAEAAWFWTAASLRARQDAVAAPGPGPCRPEDVVKCLDALYRQRRIELLHVRILRIWGWRGTAPNPAWVRQRCDARLWHEALSRLDWPLRVRGIVAGRSLGWMQQPDACCSRGEDEGQDRPASPDE